MPAEPTTPTGTRVVDDPATLRALAHPLRLRLLGLLRLHGPATASELGRRTGESSGSTSYHLRQLARWGFVQPAAEQRSRRERVWAAVHLTTSFQLPEDAGPQVRDALGVVVAAQLSNLTAGLARRADEPAPWRRAHLSSDMWVRTTPEGLVALKDDLHAVLRRHADREPPEGARTVMVQLHSYPAEDRS